MAAPSTAIIPSELAAAALSCEPLARARALAGWVGAGRTLTASGVLRPADAAQACRELGIELPGPKLRSALDVPELLRDWLAALAAGFLDVDGRRVRAVPDLPAAGAAAHPDPEAILDAWAGAAAAVLDLGDDPCAGCLLVLHELHTADGPRMVDELGSAVRAALADPEEPADPEDVPCPGCGEVHGPAGLPGLDAFLDDEEDEDEEDPARHAAGTVDGLLAFGAAEAVAGAVRLTTLGTMLAVAVFDGHAPSPGAGAATVVSAISELPPPVAMTVAGPWLSARSAADAARELLAFASSADPGQRLTALAFAGELGADAAPAWREWAERPGAGAYARQWLSSHGEEVAEDPADEPWLAVDALSLVLDDMPPTAPPFLLQAMLMEQAGDAAGELAEVMLRSGHPRAGEVVAVLTGEPAGGRGRRPEAGTRAYQLKITLSGVSQPPVWRRVLVPAAITLRDLHGVIQLAMGWEDCHLYMFSTGRQHYGPPDAELGYASDRKAQLHRLLTKPGDTLRYTYDFGDGWEHDLVLEEIRPELPETDPACLAGGGACPPEDCGGAWGYENLKEILASPAHEEHEEMLEWLGLDAAAEFDPREFSLDEANSELSLLAKTR